MTSIREQTQEIQELATQFEEGNQNFEREFQNKFVTNCAGSDDSGFWYASEEDFIEWPESSIKFTQEILQQK